MVCALGWVCTTGRCEPLLGAEPCVAAGVACRGLAQAVQRLPRGARPSQCTRAQCGSTQLPSLDLRYRSCHASAQVLRIGSPTSRLATAQGPASLTSSPQRRPATAAGAGAPSVLCLRLSIDMTPDRETWHLHLSQPAESRCCSPCAVGSSELTGTCAAAAGS